jgi:chorismate dehydratase
LDKIKIVAVSYLNTLPFIYGMEQLLDKNSYELLLCPPATCAEILANNQADIGLIPVAAIPTIYNAQLITSYCIGSVGKVDTVCLFSDVPLNKIKNVLLDYESKTSINLVKVLAKNYWKINPTWEETTMGYEKFIKNNTAGVVIGDKVFQLKHHFKYSYDLSEEWQKMTNLPFVFACWVANKKIADSFINQLNQAFEFGISNISTVTKNYHHKNIHSAEAENYLTNYISYSFDKNKIKAYELFMNYLSL